MLLSALSQGVCAGHLKVYPAPDGAVLNDDFSVKVRQPGGDWLDVSTYLFKVDRLTDGRHQPENTSVASFDFEGKVEVAVTCRKQRVDSCRVRPLSYGIIPRHDGHTITFVLDRPRYLSIEVNGDIYHNLQLFANGVAPKVKRGKGVIYFGPGIHRLPADSMAVPSGTTVYIDGGAIVKGWFSVWKAHDVRILGHGIVEPGRHEGIMVRYSRRVTIDGPITTQIPVGGSDSVDVRNAKVISSYGWGDGFNVFASNNVSYNHVFARTSDDCSTIYCTRKGYRGGCRNIRVRDAVYWADVAHPVMIGLHGDIAQNEVIEDVVYDDIDILEQSEPQIDYQGCLAINNGDNILVRRITFQNVRIESLRQGMLFNMRVCFNKKYCAAPGRGIEDILLRNISYNGAQPNLSILSGYDAGRRVRNIRFENLRINGRHISDDMPGKLKWYKTADYARIFIGEHTEGVAFF